MRLMVQIAGILMKLLATFKGHMMRLGRVEAERLMLCLQSRKAEEWAPRALEWVKDQRFITYLGVLATNVR